TAHWSLVTSFATLITFAVPAIFLVLGLLTPCFAALAALVECGVLFTRGGQDQFHLGLAILGSTSVALLGPGAYSVDARLFGRRLLSHAPHQRGS
ncbi:MAG TPA: hypothetical protein VGD62_07760, partial [Acidobacteriaceae bacterium]